MGILELTIILSLIIIVAAFNIISGLTILVKNKTRDIAILKYFSSYRTFQDIERPAKKNVTKSFQALLTS